MQRALPPQRQQNIGSLIPECHELSGFAQGIGVFIKAGERIERLGHNLRELFACGMQPHQRSQGGLTKRRVLADGLADNRRIANRIENVIGNLERL